MKTKFFAAALALGLASPALARDEACHRPGCPTLVSFLSVSALRSYALLIAAPDTGCRRVRFQVEADGTLLGRTPPLEPGELAVVRLGQGFPEGEARVTVASIGCDAPPAATRRVVMAKIGPDHGWRVGN